MAFSGETEEVVLTVNGIKKVSGYLELIEEACLSRAGDTRQTASLNES